MSPCGAGGSAMSSIQGAPLGSAHSAMAISAADNRRERGAPSTQPSSSSSGGPRAPLGPTLALTMALAVGVFVVVVGLVLIPTSPKPLAPPLAPEEQTQESALYALLFFLILPVALIAVPRLADAIAVTPNGGALSVLSAVLVAALAAAILVLRALPDGGTVIEGVAVIGAWTIGALAILARARQPRAWPRLQSAAELAPYAWAVAGALVFGTLFEFTSVDSISVVPVALGALAGSAVLVLNARGGTGLPRVPRPWGFAIDALLIVLCLLAVPDLAIFTPGGSLGSLTVPIVQFHQDFFLGPVNEILHGSAVLVDTASQYGVGSLYFLAGWFQLAPIGYGTLGFLDGALFALFFAAGYGVLRLAGTSRLLAGSAIALAIVVLIYNLALSVGSLPQHGPLRFGLPMVVIVAATIGSRWPRHAQVALTAQLLAVALSSLWALEAFAYTSATFAAIACFRAWALPEPGRLASLARVAVLAVGACVGAHVVLAVVTLAASGHLPDWGEYLAYLNEFLFGQIGDLTYDFSPWSAGLPVGAAYAASAAAFVLVVGRRRDLVDTQRTALVAICGTTAYGIGVYTYFVNRSADHILPYVSLPVVMIGALWLSLLLRGALIESRTPRLGGLAFALAVSVLVFSVSWSSIGPRFPRTALAHVVPGGESLRAALHRLWNEPPFHSAAAEGVRLVDRYMPGQDRVPIVASPDLETEILLRSGRANGLGLSYPTEDSFVPSQNLPRVRQAVDELRPGDRLIMQTTALKVLSAYRAQPSRNPLSEGIEPGVFAPGTFAPLQEWALKRIGERFGIRVIRRDDQGLVVVALKPRR